MTQDEFNELCGDAPVKWNRMTVRQPGGRVIVFYEREGTLVAHEFHVYGE